MRVSNICSQAQLTTIDEGMPLWVLHTAQSQGATLIEANTKRQAEKKAEKYLMASFGKSKAERKAAKEWFSQEDNWWEVLPLFGMED